MQLTPDVAELYRHLLQELQTFGNIIIEEKKTSIHIKNKYGFAGIHPRKNYFILNIVSTAPIKIARVIKTEQVSKSRYHNEIRIESEKDINPEVVSLLKEAYTLMA